MNKLLALTLTLITFQSQAFFPTSANLDREAKKIVKKEKAERNQSLKKQDQNTCANFQGNWKGTCESSSKSFLNAFSLEQSGCTTLWMKSNDEDGNAHTEHYDLTGIGIKSVADSSVFMTFGVVGGARWNNDQTVVSIEGSGIINSPFMNSTKKLSYSALLMKDGNDLLVFAKTTGGADGDTEESCRLQLAN